MKINTLACTAVLVLAACLALPATAQPNYVLNLTLNATRVGDKAVGIATIVNPTKQPVEVGKLWFDIRFDDKDSITKDDIRQQFNMPACSSTKLPTKLAPGAALACPFTSNDNIYHGAISIVSGAMKLTEDNASGNYLGFDVIPKLMPISAASKPPSSKPASSKPPSSKPAAYTATLQANIPGKDIACGRKDYAGKPAAFCKVCGGKAAVQAACDARKECAAFDMEGSDCGYLKAAKGPFKKPANGFTSYAKA
ncbi:hypothetical protein OEZ86_006890 [Tetradesmus obliquus]|nr:hypothetical protein OEZ86_006890 [Tetradesmus obliquus]